MSAEAKTAVELRWSRHELEPMLRNSRRRSLMAGALFLVAAGLAACSSRADIKPSVAAVAGVWTLDPASLPSVAHWTGKSAKDSKIMLFTDGRLQAVRMPIEDASINPTHAYLSGEGRWEMQREQDHWMLIFILDHGAYSFYFTDDSAMPSGFYSIVDGPDSGERWVWTKSAAVDAGDKR